MKLITAGNGSDLANTVVEKMTEYLKSKRITDVKLIAIASSEANISADVVVMVKEFNKGAMAKVFMLSDKLKGKMKVIGDEKSKVRIPAVPRNVLGSIKFRKAIKANLLKQLNVQNGQLIMLQPSATPIHADSTSAEVVAQLCALSYNEIAITYLEATKQESPALSFALNKEGFISEELGITVSYASSNDQQVTDWFGFDVRNDISIEIGQVSKTEDDLNDSSNSDYGKAHAYFDAMHCPRPVPGSGGWGEAARNIPYAGRLVINQFSGPDDHVTLSHELLAIAAARAVTEDKNALLYALYPEYHLPKDQVSLRNVGALAMTTPVNEAGKPEFIRVQDRKFSPDMYKQLMAKLFQQDLIHVGMAIKPFGPRAATHQVLYEAAVGASPESRKTAKMKILNEANRLTGGNFPVQKWAGKEIFIPGSATIQFDGEFLNPVSNAWEDLAKLQDAIAAANLLLAKGGAKAEVEAFKRFTSTLVPSNGAMSLVVAQYEMLQTLSQGDGDKFLRINDHKFIPLFAAGFVTDLQIALTKVVKVRREVRAPEVTQDEGFGASYYNFGADSGEALGGTGFGNDAGDGFGNGFGNFSGSNWN